MYGSARSGGSYRAEQLSFTIRVIATLSYFAPGENVMGRDEEAAVCIDAPGVSRRHARIAVDENRAVLEDLGSKNGTFLGDVRLEGPRVLNDGDTFRLGRLLLVYRSTALRGSTQTEAGAEPA